MPLYQYKCDDCGADLERRQSFSDSPLTECPSCGGKLRRVLQPVGIVFKGSGWYCTDSRGNGTATLNGKSSSSGESSSSSNGEAKGDSGTGKKTEAAVA